MKCPFKMGFLAAFKVVLVGSQYCVCFVYNGFPKLLFNGFLVVFYVCLNKSKFSRF